MVISNQNVIIIGKFVGFDTEKIEAAFGTGIDASHVAVPTKGQLPLMPKLPISNTGNIGGGYTTTPYPGVVIESAAVDRCINNKIKANFKATFSFSTYQTIVTLMYKRAFGAAAKELIKVGVKGNAVTIGLTLSYYFFSCLPLRAK